MLSHCEARHVVQLRLSRLALVEDEVLGCDPLSDFDPTDMSKDVGGRG